MHQDYVLQREVVVIELALHPKVITCCAYVPPAATDVYQDQVLKFLYSLPNDYDITMQET